MRDEKRLSIPQWRLMAVLAEGGLTPQALVARTAMDKVTVSRAAQGLVTRNLVERTANQTDGRSHTLALAHEAALLAGLAPPRWPRSSVCCPASRPPPSRRARDASARHQRVDLRPAVARFPPPAGPCGGIGRRAGLTIRFRKACRFEPDRGRHQAGFLRSMVVRSRVRSSFDNV